MLPVKRKCLLRMRALYTTESGNHQHVPVTSNIRAQHARRRSRQSKSRLLPLGSFQTRAAPRPDCGWSPVTSRACARRQGGWPAQRLLRSIVVTQVFIIHLPELSEGSRRPHRTSTDKRRGASKRLLRNGPSSDKEMIEKEVGRIRKAE